MDLETRELGRDDWSQRLEELGERRAPCVHGVDLGGAKSATESPSRETEGEGKRAAGAAGALQPPRREGSVAVDESGRPEL